MILFSRIAWVVLLGASLLVAARPLGPLPPLGEFLDPANGVWAVARRADLPRREVITLPTLAAPVEVLFDDRSVPHIFAASEEDAYRALGYVVARDRLFQIELQTRATAGRLAELLGPQVLRLDREQRAIGLAASADREFEGMPATSTARRLVVAYAEGVNGWIDRLSPADLPFEYRLLNARPMRFEPKFSLYLTRRMGWTLSYQTDDLRHRRVAGLVGAVAAEALFPANSPIQEPIQPGSGPYPRFDWRRIPAPVGGAAVGQLAPSGARGSDDAAGVGSNNWVVAPSRSATGHALLAGDPHLDLSLPSIWYEAHIVTAPTVRPSDPPTVPTPSLRSGQAVRPSDRPTLDVYGVTIPGAPGIVIGFNRDVAWSLTNTEADVLDYFAETFDDMARPTRYLLDGAWEPLQSRVETIRGRRGETLAVDTIYSTHRGPVVNPHESPLSIRWTVLEASDEAASIISMSAARNVAELMKGMESFRAPAQNIAAADRQGNIAIRSNGRFPLRAGNGKGSEIRDGTTRRSDWRGDWPVSKYPQAVNPRQGFLASANQQPLDPRTDATWLGQDWTAPARAMRINALLRSDSAVTVTDMKTWQTDRVSPTAELVVPFLLHAVAAGRPSPSGQARSLDRAVAMLASWDRRYTPDSRPATLFESVMQRLSAATWDELEGNDGRRVATPRSVVLIQLLQEPGSPWWDRRGTDAKETRDDILRQSLSEGFAEATRRFGDPASEGWRWDRVQYANIHHLLRIPAFSALELPAQGGPATLSPSSGDGSTGASWRMVVDLGPEIRAWGIYPGGQSGNPVSARYGDRIPAWAAGELDSLRVPRRPEDVGGISSRLQLRPGGR